MRRVGTVVRTVGGLAVARSPDDTHPDIGASVVDDGLATVGRIVDVMGPVSRPYLVVTPEGNPADLLNERLYVR
jgi:RNA-binding protein